MPVLQIAGIPEIHVKKMGGNLETDSDLSREGGTFGVDSSRMDSAHGRCWGMQTDEVRLEVERNKCHHRSLGME